MADVRSCPSCDRPNGLSAKRCLYCSAVLPPIPPTTASPESDSGFLPELNTGDLDPLPGLVLPAAGQPMASALPAFESPQFASSDEALLDGLTRGGGPFGPREAALRFILLPDSRYAAQLEPMRQAIHEYLDIDLYTATQALQKEIPSYLGSTGHPDIGKFVAGPLRELGIRVLMIERASWLEGTEPERVVKLNLADPEVVTFIREDGSSFEVIRGAIRWAAVGEVRPEGLMPSIGDPKNASDEGRSLGVQEGGYQLLDLLRRDNRRPIRIRSDSFDFSALGPDQGLSANLNLRKLLGQLTRDPSNPEVLIPLDENFRKVPHLPGGGLGAAGGVGSINRRELEFTEYVLLLDARHHF